MSIQNVDIAKPCFDVKYIEGEAEYKVKEKVILFNFSEDPVMINDRPLPFFKSTVVTNTAVKNVKRCLIVEGFDSIKNTAELYKHLEKTWELAWDRSHEDRLKGVRLWRSPKIDLGAKQDIQIGFHYAGCVPLNVGLHITHGGKTVKEVHTQITGYGKMQECYENDLKTLYREDYMSPGYTHPIMYDKDGVYPWHQFETITEGIFMSVWLLEK